MTTKRDIYIKNKKNGIDADSILFYHQNKNKQPIKINHKCFENLYKQFDMKL